MGTKLHRPVHPLLVVLLAATMTVPPAVASVGGVLGEEPPQALTLETPAGSATIDLTTPGGGVVSLAAAEAPSVVAGGGEGVGFTLEGQALPEEPWTLARVDRTQPGPGAATAAWELGPDEAPLLTLERTFMLRQDEPGLAIETELIPHAAATVTDYRLLGVELDPETLGDANLTTHDYHGGADWRDVFHIPRDATAPSDHRAQALTAFPTDGPGLVTTMVRRGADASRVATMTEDGATQVRLNVNLSREIITTGPIEPHQANTGENPGGVGARALPLTPDQPVTLEPVLLATGENRFSTLWSHHQLLTEEGPGTFEPTVTYNTNVWDGSPHPTADTEEELFLPYYQTAGSTPYMIMNRSIFAQEVPMADRAGVETFVVDDGWQYLSGDWTPHPAKFPGGFGPERRLLEDHGMELGLWMSPLEFNGRSRTAHQNPDWICHPTGTALMAYPDQAGFAIWNAGHDPFRDHLVDEIGRLHRSYGAQYLKFDFMTWVDCAGTTPTTIHEYALGFREVLRQAHERYPELTLQLDETNDNRLAAMGSIWQGPNWFHNGDPGLDRTLRILASLAPLVPLHYVGMPVFNGPALEQPDELLGAGSLWGHPTIWDRLSEIDGSTLDTAGDWFRVYRAHRPLFGGMTLDVETPATYGLERVNPDTGSAFVAVLDPQGSLQPGSTVDAEVQLPCEGEIARFDPLGRRPSQVLGTQPDELRVELTVDGRAGSAMLVCLDETPQLAYGPHLRADDTLRPKEDTVTFTLAGPEDRTRGRTWIDTADRQVERVHAGGETLTPSQEGRLIEVEIPADAEAITVDFAS